jgi:translation initiation factor 1
MGLPWMAISRGLAVGKSPTKGATVKALEGQGIRSPDIARPPVQATAEDFKEAARVIALNRGEHEPLVREHFPLHTDLVEYWQIAAGDVAGIEREVMALVTRLLGGRMDAPEPPPPLAAPKKVLTAKVGRETAGRRGKGVTTIFDLPIAEKELIELAAILKTRCGTGGTVKDGRIEIQGDNRDRVAAELEKLGYKVKRAGG